MCKINYLWEEKTVTEDRMFFISLSFCVSFNHSLYLSLSPKLTVGYAPTCKSTSLLQVQTLLNPRGKVVLQSECNMVTDIVK